MKTIGLLGGMSWESTVSYYRIINEEVRTRLGGQHSAKICLYSVNFDEIERLQHAGAWDKTADILTEAAGRIEGCGADFLVVCTNTMHKVVPEIEKKLSIPILHIADATAEAIVKKGLRTIGLLGTKFTMEQDFYKGRLEKNYGLKVVIPDSRDRDLVHHVIYDELCLGKVIPASQNAFLDIIRNMKDQGAGGVILGCTEIALLVHQEQTDTPLFDTTEIHALKSVEMALAE
jgi:aspartate racemase